MRNKGPVRVLHVASGDLWAGAEVMLFTLVRELSARNDIDVTVVLMNHGRLFSKLKESGVSVIAFDESSQNGASILVRLFRLVQRLQPHVIHTHRQKENVLGAICSKLTGVPSIRTVHGWTEHSALGFRLDKRLFRWLDAFVARKVQKVIVSVSHDLADRLRTGLAGANLTVIENGVDIQAVQMAATTACNLPTKKKSIRIGIVGRLVPVKRHDRFLAIAETLLREGRKEFEFYIIGDGPLYDSIDSQVRNLNLSDYVHMLGFRSDILSVLSRLDALLVVSDHEGTPMSVLEAAAIGIPILSVPLPSIQAIIDSGAMGEIALSDNPARVADCIERAANASALGKDPKLDDNWLYSSKVMTRQYVRLYENLARKAAEVETASS